MTAPVSRGAGDGRPPEKKLGMRILQGLADQIHGTLATELDQSGNVMETSLPFVIGLAGHCAKEREIVEPL
jgi:hypothetical protein